jgi:hypothetical protein
MQKPQLAERREPASKGQLLFTSGFVLFVNNVGLRSLAEQETATDWVPKWVHPLRRSSVSGDARLVGTLMPPPSYSFVDLGGICVESPIFAHLHGPTHGTRAACVRLGLHDVGSNIQ